MIKRGQKRKETALNDRNLPLKTSSSQSFYPLRVFGENSSQCNLTGQLENVEMRRTDAQYAKSLISFQNSSSLSMLTSSNIFPHTLCVVSASDETTHCCICLSSNKDLYQASREGGSLGQKLHFLGQFLLEVTVLLGKYYRKQTNSKKSVYMIEKYHPSSQ